MANAEELFRKIEAAKERLAKIGRREPHLQDSYGRLTTLIVTTEVCHQAAPSATNYWRDEAFDFALADVIKARFGALADEAISRMEKRANEALIEEEAGLRARLERIEKLKAAA
jgi:hypothetical protein